jgi:biotin transporter BioY
MFDVSLGIVSTVAGIWNVLHEKFTTVRRAVCVFLLGFSFCYGTAVLATVYGLDSEAAAVVGYLAGITSSTLYNVLIKIIYQIPQYIERKLNK